MSEKEIKDIRIIVENENSLYVPYSPESEFNEGIKSYIRSKVAEESSGSGIRLIVMSSSPINEEKFKTANRNWIRDQKAIFAREDKISTRTLLALLVFASLFIILSMYLSKYDNVFSYTIIPVLGSVALGRAAGMFITELPVSKGKKYYMDMVEKNSTVVFERIDA